MSLRIWSLLLLLGSIWGGSFFFVAVMLQELPFLTTVFLRLSLAAGVLLVVLKLRKEPLGFWTHFPTFAFLGLFNNVIPFGLITYGQQSIDSGLASIINAATPLSGIVIAHFVLPDEPMSIRKLTGVLVGLSGIVLMMGTTAWEEVGSHLLAEVAVFGATVSFGIAGSFGKLRLKGIPPLQAAAGMLCASSLWLIGPVLVVDGLLETVPRLETLGAWLGLSLLSTSFAYLIFFRILAEAGPSNLLLVTMIVPVSANLLGVSFLGEALSLTEIGGLGLLALGLLVVDGRLLGAGKSVPLAKPPAR